MVRRHHYMASLKLALKENPVCALLGPRQCGKTTLARKLASSRKNAHFYDLETAAGRARLAEPELSLAPLKGLVVIDEIQRLPGLFTALRPLADRPGTPARFLILGSASPHLVRGVSESLAGRIGFVDLGGFDLREVGGRNTRTLWLRGGLPRSFLTDTDEASMRWRESFIRTFLERDVLQIATRIPPENLRRFWQMAAHHHAQMWNAAAFARSLGTSERTARNYLDLLTGAYVLRQLQPWHANTSKRQYKAPKIFVRDTGLLHALLSISSHHELQGHTVYGPSWEGFAVEQVLSAAGFHQAYFWRTHAGAELDLMLIRRGKRYGVEFKCADAPEMTKSLGIALDDLELEKAWIVYPGTERYRVHRRVEVMPVTEALAVFSKMR